ncbi:hypothetical protein ACFL67_01130 [candidate division KSB1 bacterium]
MKRSALTILFLILFTLNTLHSQAVTNIPIDLSKTSDQIVKAIAESIKDQNLNAKLTFGISNYDFSKDITIKLGDKEIKKVNLVPDITVTNFTHFDIEADGSITNLNDLDINVKRPFTISIDYNGKNDFVEYKIGDVKNQQNNKTKVSLSTFDDAVNLKKAIAIRTEDIVAILAKYLPEDNSKTFKDIKTYTETNNLFLFNQIKDINALGPKEGDNLQTVSQSDGLNISGFPSPTMTIDMVGTFLARRVKQELQSTFFSNLKKKLKNDETLQKFFPATHNLLLNVDVLHYNLYFEALQKSFKRDLDTIPSNLALFLKENSNILPPEEYNFFMTSLELITALQKSKHPADIFEGIVNYTVLEEFDENVQSAFHLIAMISRNLRSGGGDKIGWIKANDLARLSDPVLLELFVGLVFEKERKICSKKIIFGKKSIASFIKSVDNTAAEIEESSKTILQYVYRLSENARIIQSFIANYDPAKKPSIDEYYDYASTVVDILRDGLKLKGFPGILKDEKYEHLLKISSNVLEISHNVAEKQYSMALVNSVKILNEMSLDNKAANEIIFYGNFMAAFVKAESKEEMINVLETAALPVGSYRIKRNTQWGVSLNSYVGVMANSEKLSDNDLSKDMSKTSFGLTSPVGFALNFIKCNNSLSIYFPVIDVGAVTHYRLKSGEEDSFPELTFNNVFAPGIFIIYNFIDNPISIGGGMQIGPGLREIKDGNAVIEAGGYKISAFAAIDIPIFNFFTKKKEK